MPIPKTKDELLQVMDQEYRLLLQAVRAVDPARRELPGACHHWSVKDVLAHLVEWKTMFLRWHAAGTKGENPRTPAEDLTWRQTPELNRRIYAQWRDAPWDKVIGELERTNAAVRKIALATSEADLFRKHLQPWMRVWPLARWIAANTSSHYRWARTHLRRFAKAAPR